MRAPTLADLSWSEMHFYVMSPYAKYEKGMDAAADDAAAFTASLVDRGIDAFSPIVHGHQLQKIGKLKAAAGDHSFWLRLDKRYMDRADAGIVAMLPGWDVSTGVKWEIEQFVNDGLQVFYVDPITFAVSETAP